MMPSLFVAHGAPLLAIEDNEYTRFLSELGQSLKRPKAIILFSAHWESPIQKVSQVTQYETIYDFGGFPEALYQIKYPAKGDLKVASEIGRMLDQAGLSWEAETSRGLDHGAWVVLRLLFPGADIPVIAMSVNPHSSSSEQYGIGKALAELKRQDVLILASGGTVHNLRAVDFRKQSVDEWAQAFDEWLEEQIHQWNTESLFDYAKEAPYADLAVPPFGKEHFIPLFYAMGAGNDSRQGKLLHRSYQYGNLSQTVWQFE